MNQVLIGTNQELSERELYGFWQLWAQTQRKEVERSSGIAEQPWSKNFISPPNWEGESSFSTKTQLDMAAKIQAAVQKLRTMKPHESNALVVYYGAYPNPAKTLQLRCAEKSVAERTTRRNAKSGRIWVEFVIGVR